jgi:hypothetical protein
MMWMVDKKSGKRAVIFDVGAIRWVNDTHAEVEGGYVCGDLCMAGGTYQVFLDGTKWAVSGFEARVMS